MVSLRQFLFVSALAVAGSATNHTIVAQSDLTFSPSEISAVAGDWLIFQFQSQNHSVASGPFDAPCKPASSGGFFSGYFPTSSGTNENKFAVKITDASKPIWFYCTQAKHCANGMVGVVNPTKEKTLDMYKAGASAFGEAAVAPASVTGGTVERPTSAGTSLRVSVAGLIGLLGAAALGTTL